jgi:hypothetical protein
LAGRITQTLPDGADGAAKLGKVCTDVFAAAG